MPEWGLVALQIAENDMQYVQSLAFASISGATGSISRSDGTYDWGSYIQDCNVR